MSQESKTIFKNEHFVLEPVYAHIVIQDQYGRIHGEHLVSVDGNETSELHDENRTLEKSEKVLSVIPVKNCYRVLGFIPTVKNPKIGSYTFLGFMNCKNDDFQVDWEKIRQNYIEKNKQN